MGRKKKRLLFRYSFSEDQSWSASDPYDGGSKRMAFLLEKKMQDLAGIQSKVTIDGYHNFIFVNRFGNVQNQGT